MKNFIFYAVSADKYQIKERTLLFGEKTRFDLTYGKWGYCKILGSLIYTIYTIFSKENIFDSFYKRTRMSKCKINKVASDYSPIDTASDWPFVTVSNQVSLFY